MKDTSKQFNIVSLSKDDLLGLKTIDKNDNIKPKFSKSKIMKLSNTDMEKIASKLCDDYCDQLYWSSLEIIADNIINR